MRVTRTLACLACLASLSGLAGPAAADYQPTVVHVVLLPDVHPVESVLAAEFAIANLPIGPCVIVPHWNTDLVLGDLVGGMFLYFDPPLTGPPFYLGYLEFFVFQPLGDDYMIEVVPSQYGRLMVLDGGTNQIQITGGRHIFNCSDEGICSTLCGGELFLGTEPSGGNCYQDAVVMTTPAAASSWSAVKSLY